MSIKNILSRAIASILFLPFVVFAQAPGGGNVGQVLPPQPANLPGNQSSTFNSVLRGYINVFLMIVGLIAVAYLIWGGFQYITSRGNEEAAEEAKRIIQNSIIGLIVIILSYVIITVITNALFGRVN